MRSTLVTNTRSLTKPCCHLHEPSHRLCSRDNSTSRDGDRFTTRGLAPGVGTIASQVRPRSCQQPSFAGGAGDASRDNLTLDVRGSASSRDRRCCCAGDSAIARTVTARTRARYAHDRSVLNPTDQAVTARPKGPSACVTAHSSPRPSSRLRSSCCLQLAAARAARPWRT